MLEENVFHYKNMLFTGNEVRQTTNHEPPAIAAIIGTVGYMHDLQAL